MDKGSKIFVAGHRGLVGSAIVRKLTSEGYLSLLLRSHAELDLGHREQVGRFLVETERDCTVRGLVERVRDLIGPKAPIQFGPTKPDETPRKLLDVSRIESLRRQTRIGLSDGVQDSYRWFLETHAARGCALR